MFGTRGDALGFGATNSSFSTSGVSNDLTFFLG